MSSSDDGAEVLPLSVSNYHFVDDKKEIVSFAILPILWAEGMNRDDQKEEIFLDGFADNGLQKIFKQVIAWRFDLSNVNPEISVLAKEDKWIKLIKPRKSFEDVIRTILITVHCLHVVKRNPKISEKSLWDQLSRIFCLFEVRPWQNDLVDHMPLIREAVTRDNTLGKSEFLLAFIEERHGKRKLSDEDVQPTTRSEFIVDDDIADDMDVTEEDDYDENEELYDSVCAICDNGGELLCCDGKCLRSFHATVESAEDSMCDSLGFSEEVVEKIEKFYCKNCEYEQHQCFACWKLGSSAKSGAEVFSCASATCSHYYHPHCVAKLLNRGNAAAAEDLRERIVAGESFTCPVHKCCVCNEGEKKHELELQFAVCRRCPKSYHRKCLPKKIAFEDMEEEGILQRAWEGLLPNRILIYCLEHEIDEEIGTPARDHIKFPSVEDKKTTVEGKKKKQLSELLVRRGKNLPKKRSLDSEDSIQGRSAIKETKRAEKEISAVRQGDIKKKSEKVSSALESLRKVKQSGASRSSSKHSKPLLVDANKSAMAGEGKISLGDQLYALISKGNESVKSGKWDSAHSDLDRTVTGKSATKKSSSMPYALDAESEMRILDLMKESASSITLKDIMQKHKVPSTHAAYWLKNVVDKTITMGKVERAVEAVRTALQKLEEGCSIEDAQIVCEADFLRQIMKWKNKLKVYLAPFLYGMRYTSFGRHFTKVDKLEEIVDKLHWYVKTGDMLVDFCCGANDFSCLMQRKLDETGKKCSYKNYDFIQPKNDFNFEKRDWMTVQPRELPSGSQLIMGLNPPFGVKAALANKFIDKALEFKPKLIILIVPSETERLDKKKSPYDLIWEDDEFLSGKSFYLPGSVDANDRQMDQWNLKPPLLYLWSRRDWTDKHRDIAQKCGHLSKQRDASLLEVNCEKKHIADCPLEDHICFRNASTDDFPMQNDKPEELGSGAEGDKERESSSSNKGDGENHESHGCWKNEGMDISRKKSDEQNHGSKVDDMMSEDNLNKGIPPASDNYKERPHGPIPSVIDGRSSVDSQPSRLHRISIHTEYGTTCASNIHSATAYSGIQAGIPDDMGRRYNLNNTEPYSSGRHRWSGRVSPGPEYGDHRLEEQFSGCMRESADAMRSRSYITEFEENYVRESDIRSQVRLYGQQDANFSTQRSNYLSGHNPGYELLRSLPGTYGHLGSAPDLSYSMNTSTMQRYAPRLDELNPARMSNIVPEQPMMGSRNGIHDDRAPGVSYRSGPLGFAPGPQRPVPMGFAPGPHRPNPMGFAPGPQRPYSHKNSSGWLDE